MSGQEEVAALVAREVCEGFQWCGQSLLCCDDCGAPWFLHAGDRRSKGGLFSFEWEVVPYDEARKAQIPGLLAAWEANAIYQRERGRFDSKTGNYGPDQERQVGKDYPYPTGPVRPAKPAKTSTGDPS